MKGALALVLTLGTDLNFSKSAKLFFDAFFNSQRLIKQFRKRDVNKIMGKQLYCFFLFNLKYLKKKFQS